MAELAAGAVSSLLSVIRNEARLQGRVRGDVQFIKEEMESMNSFLLHLARTSPPGGEHDEQVRTWMNQVRVLAHDCNNCIDMYLYRGNPDIQRARGGLWSYLWWVPWFLQKMLAQHRAAIQLGELKNRARDVGERRLRYGVEVPGKVTAGQSPAPPGHSPAAAPGTTTTPPSLSSSYLPGHGGDDAAAADDEEDEDDQLTTTTYASSQQKREPFQLRSLEDYFRDKLADWIKQAESISLKKKQATSTEDDEQIPCVAVVASHTEDAGAVAQETLDVAATHFHSQDNVKWIVDISEAVEFYYPPLQPWEVLCYILWLLDHPKSQSKQEGSTGEGKEDRNRTRSQAWQQKWEMVYEIRGHIRQRKNWTRIEKINKAITEEMKMMPEVNQMHKEGQSSIQPLGILLHALQLLLLSEKVAAAETKTQSSKEKDETEQGKGKEEAQQAGNGKEKSEQDKKTKDEALRTLQHYNIDETASQLLQYMQMKDEAGAKAKSPVNTKDEAGAKAKSPVNTDLDVAEYKHILSELFPNSKQLQLLGKQQQDESTKRESVTTSNTSGENQIKETVHKFTREIIQELLEDTVKKLATGTPTQVQTSNVIDETKQKIQELCWEIEDNMFIKGIVNKIKNKMGAQRAPLIIIKDEQNNLPEWKSTRKALSQLECVGAVIVTTTDNTEGAKKYCTGQWEPITYSLAGLYHECVLKLTNHNNSHHQLFRSILDKCEPHEFCMKLFAHALYSNPARSIGELQTLEATLVPEKKLGTNAKKMFKFSYSSLPKDYKSCLLYLAVFRQGCAIRRSTLVGRWVAEGLIMKEDRPSSVRRAERCFEALIDRWLVHPVDIGAAGKVKSCMVGDQVHKFITKIAKKQHIVEARLSHHLARHFSIFNDIRLRSSESIDDFLGKLSKSTQLSLLKVLDLEGCHCFKKNLHYLKEICTKILLLKYLSLRDTDISQLPREINNLHELEVLDIRKTKVSETETKRVLLLKLKRLLSGHNDLVPSNTDTGLTPSVQIPHKIGKMLNMEELHNVHASKTGKELKDIGKLCQLRKLGVAIKDTNDHLTNLFQAIGDLRECLDSLSLTLPIPTGDTSSFSAEQRNTISTLLNDTPKNLKNLSINGTTQKVEILTLLATDCDNLAKVTLSNTSLKQESLNILSNLTNLRCMRLGRNAYTDTSLNMKKGEFPMLRYFIVVGSNMNDIKFEPEAAPELEKIVFSSTNINSICGVEDLPKLEELELNNSSKLLSLFGNAKKINKVTLRDDKLKESDIQILSKRTGLLCLVLSGNSSDKEKLEFNKDDLPNLNFVDINCSGITNISFSKGSAPKLKKIIWSIAKMDSITGIENLPRLMELEIYGEVVTNEVKEAIKVHKNSPDLTHYKPEKQQKAARNAPAEGNDGKLSFFWKHRR